MAGRRVQAQAVGRIFFHQQKRPSRSMTAATVTLGFHRLGMAGIITSGL
jgi:hypothetical protein